MMTVNQMIVRSADRPPRSKYAPPRSSGFCLSQIKPGEVLRQIERT